MIGAVITVSVSATAWSLDRRNEHRLLEVQTRQAGAVLAATILGIRDPLAAALEVQEATGGSATQFARSMAPITGPGRLFVSAVALDVTSGSLRVVGSAGVPPALSSSGGMSNLAATALRSSTFVVTSIGSGGVERVGYAIADSTEGGFVVYAERAIPTNRQVPAESNPAFADLDFATYLGPPTSANLATTDLPASQLPITGDTAVDVIPFGNTSITLVTVASGHLGGPLGWQIPLIFLAGGALLTAASAFAAYQLARRRRDAEGAATTITRLYGQLDLLYGEQRSLAQDLQRALLPASNPVIPGLEIATRYVAGARGVDVGGDWFSAIALDERRFAFVVGDVSGRGVDAAALMARLRFTIRAFLLEGHDPATVLSKTSRQLDVLSDGHFATTVVGIGDLQTKTISLANAGHLSPLIIAAPEPYYAGTHTGVPLGVTPGTYVTTAFDMPVGATLLAFTDGLVERRGESLDTGLDRLALAAAAPAATLDGFLTGLIETLTDGSSEDDIALLAFRWTAPAASG
jgi:serine phosphatase RsbU (regulator of sigma subunit)